MIRFLYELCRAILSGGQPNVIPLNPETRQRVNPRRLEKGQYGIQGSPVRMGVRRADGTLKSQDAETAAQERWSRGG